MEGRTLEDLLAAEGRLSVARALHISVHVLRALEQRHALGTVHGHLAPRNVRLVKRLGDPDFAELLEGDGRPGYRAPEQDAGEEVDHRADLYGASVVLFEMLTGSPFAGGDDIPRLREVVTEVDVPPEVEMLLRRGLARRPELRPACAGEYATQLHMLLKAHRQAIAEPTMLLGSAGPSPLPASPAPSPAPLQPRPAPPSQPPRPAPPPPQPAPPPSQPAPPPPQFAPSPPQPAPVPPQLPAAPPQPPQVTFMPTPAGLDRRREIVIATMIGVIVLLAAVIGGVLGAR